MLTHLGAYHSFLPRTNFKDVSLDALSLHGTSLAFVSSEDGGNPVITKPRGILQRATTLSGNDISNFNLNGLLTRK